MRLRRAVLSASLAALLSGCASDGAYVVRGRVPGGVGIVENASAVVSAEGGPDSRGRNLHER